MKGLGKILSRYAASAVGIGIFLLALNLTFFILFFLKVEYNTPVVEDRVRTIAAGISKQPDGTFAISPEARQALDERYVWAMQLDEDGNVIWSDRLPEDMAKHYTASQIAAFSRWYLHEYPVYVWGDEDGLLVLASPIDSEWKYPMTMNAKVMDAALQWLPVVLLLNGLAALLLALLLGWRLFGAVRPVAQAIDQLADGEAVELAENGLLGALAADLNRTSHTLSQQKALLDKRDRTRTQWIAGVSHDIRTPLAIVQGNAAQLADDDALPTEARRKAQQIVRHSQRLSQLVSDLNLASKLEYQMQPLTLAPFRPAALLRTAAADALNETDRDVQLDVEIPPALEALQLTGDASLLGRAIGNLLRNSLTHAHDPLAIALTLAVQSGFCLITVTDNGPGLSDNVLKRLRAPLPQEIPTHGLGLILVSQILAAHHGSVNFQNQTPHGLTVTLYLPLT